MVLVPLLNLGSREAEAFCGHLPLSHSSSSEPKSGGDLMAADFPQPVPELTSHPSKRGPYLAARNHPCGLTEKEVEVLKLMVKGTNNVGIAGTLKRSRRTIEHHVSGILTKLGVTNRMEAALRALSDPRLLQTDRTKIR
jgi:DNA-binding NarL/FixJ family response regulator